MRSANSKRFFFGSKNPKRGDKGKVSENMVDEISNFKTFFFKKILKEEIGAKLSENMVEEISKFKAFFFKTKFLKVSSTRSGFTQ